MPYKDARTYFQQDANNKLHVLLYERVIETIRTREHTRSNRTTVILIIWTSFLKALFHLPKLMGGAKHWLNRRNRW